MFGLLGRIFGSGKAIGKVVETAGKALDALHYSEEEKAEIRLKLGHLIIDWIDKSKGQNLARRVIALGTLTVWLGNYVLAGLYTSAATWVAMNPEKELLVATLKEHGDFHFRMADGLGGEIMLIFGFYFAAPHLGQFVGPAIRKIENRLTGPVNNNTK